MSNWPHYHDEALNSLDPDLSDLENHAARSFLVENQITTKDKLIEIGPIGIVRLSIDQQTYETIAEFLAWNDNLTWPRHAHINEYLRANAKFYDDLKGPENKNRPVRLELFQALERRLLPSLDTLLKYDFAAIREFASEVSTPAYTMLVETLEKYESLLRRMEDWL